RAHAVFLSAFPDLQITVEGTVAEGDEVVVRWSVQATHVGDGLGLPATGRAVSFRGMTWIRYRNGKMIEGWDCWNQAGLIQSLRGPEPPPCRRDDRHRRGPGCRQVGQLALRRRRAPAWTGRGRPRCRSARSTIARPLVRASPSRDEVGLKAPGGSSPAGTG